MVDCTNTLNHDRAHGSSVLTRPHEHPLRDNANKQHAFVAAVSTEDTTTPIYTRHNHLANSKITSTPLDLQQ